MSNPNLSPTSVVSTSSLGAAPPRVQDPVGPALCSRGRNAGPTRGLSLRDCPHSPRWRCATGAADDVPAAPLTTHPQTL